MCVEHIYWSSFLGSICSQDPTQPSIVFQVFLSFRHLTTVQLISEYVQVQTINCSYQETKYEEAAQSIPTRTAELRVQIHVDTEAASGELNTVRPSGSCAICISFKNLLQVVGNLSLL